MGETKQLLYICPRAKECCQAAACSHRTAHRLNSNCGESTSEAIHCPTCVPIKKQNKGVVMIEKAKSIATTTRTIIKPYEKYIGLVILAVVIDHFCLDSKFASRFKSLAEAIVDKITGGLDKVIHKLTDGIIEEVEDK